MPEMLLFDLDGTLLRSDKTISQRTLNALEECRKRGIIIGISTSRGEQNAAAFMGVLRPQVLICSGGALIKYNDKYIYGDGIAEYLENILFIYKKSEFP